MATALSMCVRVRVSLAHLRVLCAPQAIAARREEAGLVDVSAASDYDLDTNSGSVRCEYGNAVYSMRCVVLSGHASAEGSLHVAPPTAGEVCMWHHLPSNPNLAQADYILNVVVQHMSELPLAEYMGELTEFYKCAS